MCGPSRAGKSDLLDEIIKFIAGRYPDYGAPIAADLTPEIGHNAFSMNGLLTALLLQLGDRAPERHVAVRLPRDFPVGPTKTGTAKIAALCQLLQRERPAALLLDEAGYFAMGTPREMQSNMRVLTYIAGITRVPIVLFGTYEALKLINVADDINGRIRKVHLARYRDTKEDRAKFQKALEAFDVELLRLGLRDESFQLRDYPRFLYESAFGRFGLVFKLVDLACDIAREDGTLLRLTDLKTVRPHLVADPLGFQASMLDGEKAFDRLSAPLPSERTDMTESQPIPTTPKPEPTTRRVGERKPGHDPALGAWPNRRPTHA